jgi:hypothetical protein
LLSSQTECRKSVIGGALRFHTEQTQAAEIAIGVKALNRMLDLGCPKSIGVAQ